MRYNTDKHQHGLIEVYEKMFERMKDKQLTILEVGVYNGGSLLWMVDYFKNSKIVGADIALPNISHERIVMDICDQNNSERLEQIGLKYGPFDIIIDDGSHRYAETKNTFDNLYKKFLNPGGMYVIEDFIAGYWPEYKEYKDLHKLVFEIAEKKNELDIKAFNIFLKDPKLSIAYFVKK